MRISYVKNKEIDFKKWDECIHASFNGIIYAYSWYLDSTCDDWDALISGNYEAVMPLPKKMVFKRAHLYSPLLARQLGIFSTKIIDEKMVGNFLKNIPREFRKFEINLNKFNKAGELPHFISYKNTYELDLISPYTKIFKNYSLEVRENLIEAYKNKVSIVSGMNPNDFINLIRNNKEYNNSLFSENDYKSLRLILTFGIRHKLGEVLTAYTKENNLCAAGLFISSNEKAIFLFSAHSEEGIKNKAVFLMIDYFISTHVEKGLTLSFENLVLDKEPSVYTGFGAKKYMYAHVREKKFVWNLNPFRKR